MRSTGSRHGRPDASQTIAQTAPGQENSRPDPARPPKRVVQWVGARAPEPRGRSTGPVRVGHLASEPRSRPRPNAGSLPVTVLATGHPCHLAVTPRVGRVAPGSRRQPVPGRYGRIGSWHAACFSFWRRSRIEDRAGRPEGGNRHETSRNCALHPGSGRLVGPGRGGGGAEPGPPTRGTAGAGGTRPQAGAATGGPGPERAAPPHDPAAPGGVRRARHRTGPRPARRGAAGRAEDIRTRPRHRAGPRPARSGAAGRAEDIRTRPRHRAGPRPARRGAAGRAKDVRTRPGHRAGPRPARRGAAGRAKDIRTRPRHRAGPRPARSGAAGHAANVRTRPRRRAGSRSQSSREARAGSARRGDCTAGR